MAFLLFIGGIIALAAFVTVLMMDPTDPFEATPAASPEPKFVPAPKPAARPTAVPRATQAVPQKRSKPAFFEQIGPQTVVLPEIEQSPARSPYVVDLSNIDARK